MEQKNRSLIFLATIYNYNKSSYSDLALPVIYYLGYCIISNTSDVRVY